MRTAPRDPSWETVTTLLPPDAPARRMADPPPPVSRAIGLARLICIVGMVWVHGWTGLGGDEMAAQAGSPQDVLRWTLVELFGRSAVPMLGIVSGWLVARSLARRGPERFVAGKARSVLLPMLLWNAIALIVVLGAGRLGVPDLPAIGGPGWIADNLLNLRRAGDINVQTNFLRDLFLCMLAAPLLVRLPTTALLSVAGGTAIWAICGWQLFVLLRPTILLFVIGGIIARRQGLAERLAVLAPWRAALPFVVIAPARIWLSIQTEALPGHAPTLVATIDLLTRGAAAVLVWRSAIALAGAHAGRALIGLERYAFFLFCSHLLFMWLLAPAIGLITGPMGSPLWPIFFLVQPLLALAFAIALACAIERLSPRAADLLSGGRLGRAQAASPAARPLAQAHWKL